VSRRSSGRGLVFLRTPWAEVLFAAEPLGPRSCVPRGPLGRCHVRLVAPWAEVLCASVPLEPWSGEPLGPLGRGLVCLVSLWAVFVFALAPWLQSCWPPAPLVVCASVLRGLRISFFLLFFSGHLPMVFLVGFFPPSFHGQSAFVFSVFFPCLQGVCPLFSGPLPYVVLGARSLSF
jgi:hypothetical protein